MIDRRDLPKLSSSQISCLAEALRRYTRFGKGAPLNKAWTGLGSATAYKSVSKAGLMELAAGPQPGYTTWWRLTDRGAMVVQFWLDCGLDYRDVESGGAKLLRALYPKEDPDVTPRSN